MGHNSQAVDKEKIDNPKIQRALLIRAIDKQQKIEEKHAAMKAAMKKEKGSFRSFTKSALTQMGLNLGNFDEIKKEYEKIQSGTDGDLQETANQMNKMRSLLGIPIPAQVDLFEDELAEEGREFADGYKAGICGAERKPPEKYGPTSQTWIKGYDEGQSVLGKKFVNYFTQDFLEDEDPRPAVDLTDEEPETELIEEVLEPPKEEPPVKKNEDGSVELKKEDGSTLTVPPKKAGRLRRNLSVVPGIPE